MSDITPIVFWSLTWSATSLLSLPVVSRWPRLLWDRGYGLTKISTWLGIGYPVWLGMSLGLWQLSQPIVLGVGLIWISLNVYLAWRYKRSFVRTVRQLWRLFAIQELIFVIAFGGFVFLRTFSPSIQGLEKFMDLGLVNTTLRAETLPPPDTWLAGETVNYYYFGHFLGAVVLTLFQTTSEVGYNLLLGTLFALTIGGAISLGGNIYVQIQRSKIKDQKEEIHENTRTREHENIKTLRQKNNQQFSNLTIERSNLEIKNSGASQRFGSMAGLLTAFLLVFGSNWHWIWIRASNLFQTGNWGSYDFADATRFIPQGIHEFPLYSFIVSDLHAHLWDLPIVLVFLTLLLVAALSKNLTWFRLAVLGWLLGLMLMTNGWDGVIYGFVTVGFILMDQWRTPLKIAKLYETLKYRLLLIGMVAVTAWLTSLPFWDHYTAPFTGIGSVPNRSELGAWLIAWGWLIPVTGGWLIWLYAQRPKGYLVGFSGWLLLSLWGLVLLPEFYYVRTLPPLFEPPGYRANTMFKLGFQAWVLLSILGAWILTHWLHQEKRFKLKALSLGLLVLLFTGYSAEAIYGFYHPFRYQGLDGTAWLSELPGDRAALAWLRQQSGQPVVVEATGDSYTNTGRMSAYSGMSTIQGWLFHEWHWRGGNADYFKLRAEEVRTVYTSSDLSKIHAILKKYQVHFIIIGRLERQVYPELTENYIRQMGEVVYEVDQTKIYRIDSSLLRDN